MALTARFHGAPGLLRGCRSSVVEHSLGKGEAVSSILTGSTSHQPEPAFSVAAQAVAAARRPLRDGVALRPSPLVLASDERVAE